MNSLPKFVASTTLSEPLEWNATLLEDPVADAVRELKGRPGGNLLVFGSLGLAHSLMEDDLVDVFQLMIVPVALGSGKRLFTERPEKTALTLTDVQTNGTGVVMLTYERPALEGQRSAAEGETSGDWWRRRTQGEG
jgi:dihydrofolate reductase